MIINLLVNSGIWYRPLLNT